MKVKGSRESLHLYINQAPIIRPENEVMEKAVKAYYNFKAEKFDADYNPDIKKSDLFPNPDDYLLFPFRLISACIVGSGTWKSTDFTNTKVLKASVSLLSSKPAYVNHDMEIGNEIGTIGETQWSNAYIAPDGTPVPAGIDGPYVIDGKLFPDLCRKLNAPIPSIQSSSVTVFYDWESSHDFENEYDFYYHVGEMLDGREVTRVVTKIWDYVESSLVYLGADPYAKKKDADGNLINIDKTSIMSNSKDEADPMRKLYKDKHEMFVMESFSKEKSIPLRQRIISNSKNKEQEDPMETEIQKFIASKTGLKPEEVTDEIIKGYSFVKSDELTSLKADALKAAGIATLEAEKATLVTEKETLSASKTALETEIATLKTEKTSMEVTATFGKEVMVAKRKECVEAYTKAQNGKANQIIVDEINNCEDPKALEAKLQMFGKQMLEEFGGSCSDCGSKKIAFRSSQHEGDDDDKKETGSSDIGKTFINNFFN